MSGLVDPSTSRPSRDDDPAETPAATLGEEWSDAPDDAPLSGRLEFPPVGAVPASTPGSAIESAEQSLRRQAQPELVNEFLAGGAMAASFTAAASVAKAKIEATTQRLKNRQDAETERKRIESQERTAGLQAREQTKQARFQAQNPPSPPATA